jgi:subfamily B ATP-binding cassette protein MsbA
VLKLAARERRAAAAVCALGVAAALFEGLGLSLLIPLATWATTGEADLDMPVIGPALDWLDARFDLAGGQLVGLVIGFFLLGIVVNYVNLTISNTLSTRFAHDLRRRVFETALTRPMSELDSSPAGRFFNTLASETWRVCDALLVIVKAVVQAIYCAVLLGFLVALSPVNTLILLAMTAAMGLMVHKVTHAVRGMGATITAANEALSNYAWDTLGGLRVVRGFGREDHERGRFEERSRRLRDALIRMWAVSNLVAPISQIMTVVMVGTIVAAALWRGEPAATLVGFLAIAYRMQPRVSAVLSAQTALKGLDAAVRSVARVLSAGAAAPQGGLPFSGLTHGIELRGVSASYPGADHPAVRDITCEFRVGRVTAIVGPSGAGKSTIVAVLLRFLEPTSGEVLVDGAPLSELLPADWRRRIAFVEQDAHLFHTTARENIAYGDLDADFAAIRAAARAAQADDFISALPQGYDSVIGAEASGLSQGQRQRVALARALLRRPQALILDEATNALDAPTERAMRAAMKELRPECAVIVIAHRRETVEWADHVVVLEHGAVVEAGDPRELALHDGAYARLFVDGAP